MNDKHTKYEASIFIGFVETLFINFNKFCLVSVFIWPSQEQKN